jgi:thioredoxin reductase (NADPH)
VDPNPPVPPVSLLESRRHQMFPVLTAAEIERIRRFGEPRSYAPGEHLFEGGQVGPGMFVILSGQVRLTRKDGFGHDIVFGERGPGQFLAEVGQLSGARAFLSGQAIDAVEVILVPPERLRALLVAEAELGERLLRALILRRMGLIELGAGGPVLIGTPGSADMVRVQIFLTRAGHPHQVHDPATDADAAAVFARYAPRPEDLPLVVSPDGSVLKNPTEAELAQALGMLPNTIHRDVYDVAVVGAGPAGLATAVYAASEGLSVLVVDAHGFGGQAGASARIENYLGFPTGISGMALAGRAFTQAQKFGAEFALPFAVDQLVCGEHYGSEEVRMLILADGRRVRARSIVVASGARYRRPSIPGLSDFEGRGVSYWASPVEARACVGTDVVLVGGGNSAGQAAVFLSASAKQVHMLVRGPNLAETMSQYLVDRLAGTGNVRLRTRTEIVEMRGTPGRVLERVRWQDKRNGEAEDRSIGHVFLFVGADPATEWLRSCDVALDKNGFVKTGIDLTAADLKLGGREGRPPSTLETNVPGVFAVGDVRFGSVKRVGGAIGEGAAVVAQLHAYLAALRETAPPPGMQQR